MHVDEVRKTAHKTKIGGKDFKLPDFDTFKKEILEELKSDNYHDLEDSVCRMRLSSDEIMEVLETKFFPSERTGYTVAPGLYEIGDINRTLENFLPNVVKVSITIVDTNLKSNLNINQTLIFNKKYFFYTILEVILSHSGPLGDIEGFIQLISGIYKSEKPNNFTGADKVHLKCDYFDGSFVKGIRETILHSFAVFSPPERKIHKKRRVKLFRKVKKSVFSHITFYLEDDSHKPIDFNNETLSFTCQLNKI